MPKAKYPKLTLASFLSEETVAKIKNTNNAIYSKFMDYQFGGKNKNVYKDLSNLLPQNELKDNLNLFVCSILLDDIQHLFITQSASPVVTIQTAELLKKYDQLAIPAVLFSQFVAIRAVSEIRQTKMPLLIPRVTDNAAHRDFNDLQRYVPTGDYYSTPVALQSKTAQLGKKAARLPYSLLVERYKTMSGNKPSPMTMWNDDQRLASSISFSWRTQYKNKSSAPITSASIFQQLKGQVLVSQFRPCEVREGIAALKKMDPHFQAQSIYDPCGGWGDRLVGFLADGADYIVYNDVNEHLQEGYEELRKNFATSKQNVYFSFKQAEKLKFDDICPHGRLHNLVYTGLPFFKQERYDSENQSYKKYPELGSWLTNFLYKTVSISASSLLPDHGYMIMNIADYSELGSEGKSKKIELIAPLLAFIQQLSWVEKIDMPGKFSYQRWKGGNCQNLSASSYIVIKRNGEPLFSPEKLLSNPVKPPIAINEKEEMVEYPERKKKKITDYFTSARVKPGTYLTFFEPALASQLPEQDNKRHLKL